MAEPAPRRATYADLEAVPPHRVAELLRGALVTHPRPAPRHALAANALTTTITGQFQMGRGGPGGWVFMVEPELHLGDDVVVPDLAGWRRERLPALPDTAWIDTPPDWVCEILSPSTEAVDRGVKREIYAGAGVPYLWLVSPATKQLEAFQLTMGKWLLAAVVSDAGEVAAPPFEAAPFSLGLLWPFDDANAPGEAPQT